MDMDTILIITSIMVAVIIGGWQIYLQYKKCFLSSPVRVSTGSIKADNGSVVNVGNTTHTGHGDIHEKK